MTTTVRIIPVARPDELYCRYPGQQVPQPVWLELDIRTGEMRCTFTAGTGNETTFAHRNRLVLAARIPQLTAAAANAFMAELTPLAQEVLNGAGVDLDPDGHYGVFTDAADAAWRRIERECEVCRDESMVDQLVSEWSAADWFGHYAGGVRDIPDVLGLDADTTDEQLEVMAGEQIKLAQRHTDFGFAILDRDDVNAYLTELRDELRADVRDELEHAAIDLAELEEKRNALIRRIKGFGVDSDTLRSIGELAGLSHTEVGRILKERTFTVAVQIPTADGGWSIEWKLPAYATKAGVPLYAAQDVLAVQTIVDPVGTDAWRVAVWDGAGADTATEPLYVYTPQERRRIIRERQAADADLLE